MKIILSCSSFLLPGPIGWVFWSSWKAALLAHYSKVSKKIIVMMAKARKRSCCFGVTYKFIVPWCLVGFLLRLIFNAEEETLSMWSFRNMKMIKQKGLDSLVQQNVYS